MEKLSALIVDDEEKAVNLLNRLLVDTKHFSSIQAAHSAESALRSLENFKPDLIFLDVRMPEKDGFSVLREMHHRKLDSQIVFVTAYDQYALEAIRQHAFGYLLKPVNREELNQCINDFITKKKDPGFMNALAAFINAFKNDRIRINTRTGYFFIDPEHILYCLADGNYTTLHMGDRQHVCSLQLNRVSDMLPPNGFERIGRSLIINSKFIANVNRKTQVLSFEKDSTIYTLTLSKSQIRALDQTIR